MNPRIHRTVPATTITLVGAIVLVGVLLASCDSGSGGSLPFAVRSSGTPSPSLSAGSTSAGGSGGASSAPSAGATAGAAGSSAGLKIGQPATVPFESSGKTISVRVVTQSITKGSIADLADYQLTAAQRASVPFYVRATFTNLGTTTLRSPGMSKHLLAFTQDGSRASPVTAPGFRRCDGSEPYPWGPGGELTECATYLVPARSTVATVTFQFNDRQNAVVWKAG